MDGIDNRLLDNWLPVLAIADIARGDWPKWVRIAARRFVAKAADPTSVKVELLIDMAEIMGHEDRMFSEDMVIALHAMADRPWPTFSRGKPITQVHMGRMLHGFGIRSKNIRIKDRQAKGYEATEIGTALSRYAPSGDASQASQKINDKEIAELQAIFGTNQSVPEEAEPSQARWPRRTGLRLDKRGAERRDIDEQWTRIKAEHAARRANDN